MPGPQARREIAAAASMPERGVHKVYVDCRKCKPTIVSRVIVAAVRLGYPPPVIPQDDTADDDEVAA